MTPPMVLMLGLLADMLGYVPLGVDVLVLLIAHGLAVRWRRLLTRQGFVLVWISFIAVAVGAALLSWGMISLLTFTLLPLGPADVPGRPEHRLPTRCFRPLFIRAHRSLAAPEEA